jgi:hypothetical protein
MITYSKIGHKGYLGNQLFKVASIIGLATRHQHQFVFPRWHYSVYFKNKLPVSVNFETQSLLEQQFSHHHWDIGEGNYDIKGCLQSEKYFDLKRTKFHFQFEHNLVQKIEKEFDFLFEKKTILISVRRGDFVNNPHYFQLVGIPAQSEHPIPVQTEQVIPAQSEHPIPV